MLHFKRFPTHLMGTLNHLEHQCLSLNVANTHTKYIHILNRSKRTNLRCYLRRTMLLTWCRYSQNTGPLNNKVKLTLRDKAVLWILFGAVLVYSSVNLQSYFKDRKCAKLLSRQERQHEKFVMPHTRNLVLFKRRGHWIPYDFIGNDNQLNEVQQFSVRPNDVFVVSFPKSGTTWVQEIVSQIMQVDSNYVDRRKIDDIFPYLEFTYPGIKELDKLSGQRCIKSHVQFDALPREILSGKGKVIYVARNAKDVTVSLYHFYKLIANVHYTGPFTEFCKIFNEGKVAYGPYWKHVADYWRERHRSNVLFIKYEDLHKNPVAEIMKIADYLGKPVNEKQAIEIEAKCAFNSMKSNPRTNYNWHKVYGLLDTNGEFMRKGKVGDWRNYYTYTLGEETDELNRQCFKPIGLEIPDEV